MTTESSQSPDFTDALREFIDARLFDMHICLPGLVQTYDKDTQKASVQPMIKRGKESEAGTREVTELPVIPEVPVVFLGSGPYSITFPVAKGDIVLLVFSEASIDLWLTRGATVDPRDDRRNNLSDAIAIPGLRSFNKAIPGVPDDALVVTADKIQLSDKDAADPVARKSDLDGMRADFDAHVHITPPGTVGGPSSVPSTGTAYTPATPKAMTPQPGSAKVFTD